VLPYFAQLAKVFSQGKYYVGGPRKVQICRGCLLTYTLIMRFCLFIVLFTVVYHGLSKALVYFHCALQCAYSLCRSKKDYPLLASSLSKSKTPLCTEMILLVEIQI
jgi:hypothetical protein